MVAESKSNNGGNLNNVRCKTSRTLRNKKMEYLKEKLRLKQAEQKYQRHVEI